MSRTSIRLRKLIKIESFASSNELHNQKGRIIDLEEEKDCNLLTESHRPTPEKTSIDRRRGKKMLPRKLFKQSQWASQNLSTRRQTQPQIKALQTKLRQNISFLQDAITENKNKNKKTPQINIDLNVYPKLGFSAFSDEQLQIPKRRTERKMQACDWQQKGKQSGLLLTPTPVAFCKSRLFIVRRKPFEALHSRFAHTLINSLSLSLSLY